MSVNMRFGPYGGRYVPETVIGALDELTEAYERCKDDPDFLSELSVIQNILALRSSDLEPEEGGFLHSSRPGRARCGAPRTEPSGGFSPRDGEPTADWR